MINARAVYFIGLCIIGSMGAYLIFLRNTPDEKYTLRSLFFRPRYLQQVMGQNDTLADLISAGWKCSPISIRTKMSQNLNRSQNDDRNSSNKTNEINFLVPNVVHYVWLGNDLNFTFVHYLSFLSVHRYIVPNYIFLYGELGPSGYWWNRTVHEVENIFHVRCVARTQAPNGKTFAFKAHDSDILRTKIIYKFGGIYMDADVIVLKSFDPLRRHRTVMGRETSFGLCNGILISAKGAPFIRMLLEQYDSYTGEKEGWADRSVLVPNTLQKVFPSLVHIEETSLQRPSWQETHLIFDQTYNWAENYAIHLWLRLAQKYNKRIPQTVKDIDCADTTIAEIGRHVIYGSKKPLSSCVVNGNTTKP